LFISQINPSITYYTELISKITEIDIDHLAYENTAQCHRVITNSHEK